MNLLNLIFPPRCIVCREIRRDFPFCGNCRERFPILKDPCCPVCALPFPSPVTENHTCSVCLLDPPSFSRTIALGLYQGDLHDLISRMKYRGEERIAEILGDWMGERLVRKGVRPDGIIPVPLHPARLRQRGFNQSAVMARRIGKRLGIPVSNCNLMRVRETASQTGLTREERGRNLKNAFGILGAQLLEGKEILLIDDVFTTGATLEACSRLLKRGGVLSVAVSVAARTP